MTTPEGVSSLLASTHDLILGGLIGYWSDVGRILVGCWSVLVGAPQSGAARLLCVVCVCACGGCLCVYLCFFLSICLFLCVYLPYFLVAAVSIAIHCIVLGARLRLPLLFCCLTHSDPSDWSLQLFSLSSSSSAVVVWSSQ